MVTLHSTNPLCYSFGQYELHIYLKLRCRKELENMSWGYVPKKLKYARRQRRMRKKYRNFSCYTCRNWKFCKKRYIPTPPIGIARFTLENCPDWKVNKEPKIVNAPKSSAKTKLTFSERIKSIFK